MPAGPLGDLAAALRRLHRQAGEPTTREVGRQIGYSHTTVAHALNGSRCLRWTVVEKIVEHLRGDPEEFRALWKAVRDAQDPLPAGPDVGKSLDTGVVESDPKGDLPTDHYGWQPQVDGSPVVMRVETKDEMIEFRHVGLALQWIKARTSPENSK